MIKERTTTMYKPSTSGQSLPTHSSGSNNQKRNGDYSSSNQKSTTSRNSNGSTRGVTQRTGAGDGGWRDSNDYRRDYFDQHNGICGYLYVCSQCFRPMFKKASMQVDHIVPPSRFAVSKVKGGKHIKTSMMARFLNHSFNCVAICPHCNQSKGNKIDYRVAMGAAMKIVELSHTAMQYVLSIPFLAVATSLWILRAAAVPLFRTVKKSMSGIFRQIGIKK